MSEGDASDFGAVPADVSAAVESMMCARRIPGLSLAVVDRDRLLFAGGFGTADFVTMSPATPLTPYMWFSMTKLVTATAAMRLVDEGRLELDAPADAYVGYLRGPGGQQPTVRQLLNHTAGLANPPPLRWVHSADQRTPPNADALLRRLMSNRPYRHPVGAAARYSNVGYLAVGQIIETVSGLPLQAYVRQAVLTPAGMTTTGFVHQRGAQTATGYIQVPRAADLPLRWLLPPGIVGTRQGRCLALRPFYVNGPAYGGLIGNVVDASRFLRLHLNDGQLDGRRVLSARTTGAMREIDEPGRPFDHGLGWFRRADRIRGDWVEHFGAGAGFWNVMRLYPRLERGVVVMTNSTRSYDFEPLFELSSTSRG